MFIVAQKDIREKTHEAIIEDVRKLVESMEGRVTRVRPWGLRQLAYEIKGNDYGYYVIMQLFLDAKQTVKLDDYLQKHEQVLRHLLLALTSDDTGTDVDVLTTVFDDEEVEKVAKKIAPDRIEEAAEVAPSVPDEQENSTVSDDDSAVLDQATKDAEG